jgi:hypothetical protein
MGIKAIRQELESMGIDTKSFIEQSEFVNALLGARTEINERKARCAECGEDEGVVNLKSCKSCMQVMYCNAICQKNHWSKHKKLCNYEPPSYATMRFQGPTGQGGLSNLLPTNASKIDMLCLASTCDFNFCTN